MSLFNGSYDQVTDPEGNPIVGAEWFFYLSGTLTPAPVYATNDLMTSLGFSVVGDSSGRFVPMYVPDDILMRAILKGPTGTELFDFDPINSNDTSSSGGGGTGGDMAVVATRPDMADLDVDTYGVAYLTEAGRQGLFRLRHASPPTDSQQGVSVASDVPGYYWERDWDFIHGKPEWFGAKINDTASSSTNLTAIHACRDRCPITILAAGTYYVSDTVYWSTGDRQLHGVAMGYGGSQTSKITLMGANSTTRTVFHLGSLTYAGVCRGMIVQDVSFDRTGVPIGSTTGDASDCVKGVLYSYATNSEMKRCRVFNSPVGFHVELTATCLLADCNVEPRASASNDICVAFLFGGYIKYPGFVGSNGSLRAEGNTAFVFPASSFCCHTMTYGYPADTWIDKHEGSLGMHGVMFTGMNKPSTIDFIAGGSGPRDAYPDGGSSNDITIANTRMDGFSGVAFFLHHLNTYTSINIYNLYSASSDTGVVCNNVEGRVNIDGGEFLSSMSGQGGVDVNNVGTFRIAGTFLRDFDTPIRVTNCVAAEIRPQIRNDYETAVNGVMLQNVDRSLIAPTLRGGTAKFTAGVVADSNCTYNNFDLGGVDPGCFTVIDAAYKLRYSGNDARADALFRSNGNLITGPEGMTPPFYVNGTDLNVNAFAVPGSATVKVAVAGGGYGFGTNGTSNYNAFQTVYGGTAAGSISVSSGATAYNTSSDKRMKKNIKPAEVEEALKVIRELLPREFDWKQDDRHQRFGLVTQEVLKIYPEAVTVHEDDNEMQGLDPAKLVFPMLIALQYLLSKEDE